MCSKCVDVPEKPGLESRPTTKKKTQRKRKSAGSYGWGFAGWGVMASVKRIRQNNGACTAKVAQYRRDGEA